MLQEELKKKRSLNIMDRQDHPLHRLFMGFCDRFLRRVFTSEVSNSCRGFPKHCDSIEEKMNWIWNDINIYGILVAADHLYRNPSQFKKCGGISTVTEPCIWTEHVGL